MQHKARAIKKQAQMNIINCYNTRKPKNKIVTKYEAWDYFYTSLSLTRKTTST